MDVLARVQSPEPGREFRLTAAGWEPPEGGLTAAEVGAFEALDAAWSNRAGYLPRKVQVRQAAEAAGLEVAAVTPEPARLLDVLF